jgi:serine/threonine-protein kinase RsbW
MKPKPNSIEPTPEPTGIPADESADGPAVEPDAHPATLHLKFDSHPQHLASTRIAVEKLCLAAGFERAAAEEVGLAVNEALANIIRHAYDNRSDQPVELQASTGPGGIEVRLRDWGSGKVPSPKPQGPTPGQASGQASGELASNPPKVENLKPGGLGLICMRSLMDQVLFEQQSDGMLLIMRRHRRAATPKRAAGAK